MTSEWVTVWDNRNQILIKAQIPDSNNEYACKGFEKI